MLFSFTLYIHLTSILTISYFTEFSGYVKRLLQFSPPFAHYRHYITDFSGSLPLDEFDENSDEDSKKTVMQQQLHDRFHLIQ